ncbi:MAG: hypothetical protein ACREOZ_04760 [Gloeomargaritales cyanobacterium]
MTKILLEERRTQLAEKINEKRSPVTFEIGDTVTTRVQVTSNSDANKVEKLTHRNRGPFTIVAVNENGSYTVRLTNNPKAATRQYPTEALHLLPPCIKAFEPLDTPDLRFLNHEHAPLLHPLKHTLDIDFYGERWQDVTSKRTHTSLSTTPSRPVSKSSSNPVAAQHLFRQITASRDKLFFISFTFPGVLRPQWFLVTVDITASALHPPTTEHAITGRYYVTFYAKHPADNQLSDQTSRWWIEWHEYHKDKHGIIELGKRVLFRPGITPDPTRYISWSDDIDLISSPPLVGPFNFADASQSPTNKQSVQHVAFDQWTALYEACLTKGIQPPTGACPTHKRKRHR